MSMHSLIPKDLSCGMGLIRVPALGLLGGGCMWSVLHDARWLGAVVRLVMFGGLALAAVVGWCCLGLSAGVLLQPKYSRRWKMLTLSSRAQVA